MRNSRCIAGFVFGFVFCGSAQEPVFLAGSKPAVLSVGDTNEIELLVRNHGKTQSLHFHGVEDSRHITAHPAGGGGSDHWQIRVGEEISEGVYSYHVGTSRGVSNPAFLIVSGWPSVPGKELSGSNPTIPMQTWVYGEVDAGSEDVYSISLESGQAYCVGVMARGLGSRLRTVLGLRDSSGRLIRESQMGELMEGVTVPVSGQYQLSVADHSYEGGDQYFYEAIVMHGGKMPQPWRDEMKSLLYRRGPLEATIPELSMLPDIIDMSAVNESQDLTWNQVPAVDSVKPVGIRSIWEGGGAPFRMRYRTVSTGRYRVEVVSYRLGVPSIPRLTLYRLGSDVAEAGIEIKDKVAVDRPGFPAYKYGDLNFAHADPVISFSAEEGDEFGIVVEDTGVAVPEYGSKSFLLTMHKELDAPVGRVILQPLHYTEPNGRQLYPFPLNLLPGQRIPVRVRTLPGPEAGGIIQFRTAALPSGLEWAPASLTWQAGGGESIVLLSAAADARAIGGFYIQPEFGKPASTMVGIFGTYGPQWKINDFNNEYAEPSLVRGFYGAITGERIAPLVAQLHSGDPDPERSESEGAVNGAIEILSGESRTLSLELRRSEHFTGEVTFKGYGPYSKLPDVKVGEGENSASLVIDTGKLGWKAGTYHPFMHASIKSVIPYANSGESVELDKKEYPFDVYTSALTISVKEKPGQSTTDKSE